MFSHPSSIRLLGKNSYKNISTQVIRLKACSYFISATYLLNAFCRSQRKQSREKIRRLPLLVATPRGEHGYGFQILMNFDKDIENYYVPDL